MPSIIGELHPLNKSANRNTNTTNLMTLDIRYKELETDKEASPIHRLFIKEKKGVLISPSCSHHILITTNFIDCRNIISHHRAVFFNRGGFFKNAKVEIALTRGSEKPYDL